MNIAQKARATTLVALAAVLLAGCASAPSVKADNGAPEAAAPSTSAEPAEALTGEEGFLEAVEVGGAYLEVIEVLSPTTFVVGPSQDIQKDKGFSGETTISTKADSPIISPAEGECGYDEATAFAKQYFAENPNDAWSHLGDFGSDNYFDAAISAGTAYIPGEDLGRYEFLQWNAQSAGTGLWSACPEFGK